MKRIIVLFALLLTLTIAGAAGTAAAETLVLPEDTTVIETEAFFNTGAETIVLPEGVTAIGDRAFGGSETLRKVYVPDSLMNREEAALEGSQDAVFVPLSSLWNDLFTWQAVNNTSVTIQKYNGTLTELAIPAEIGGLPVTVIGYQAFKGNTSLTKVVIPEGVETVQNEAFHSCASLTDVSFPSTLTKIGNNAFSGCGSDTQEPFYFRLPDGLTEVGRLISDNQMAFYNCGAVKIVTPDSATARLLSQKNAEMCWFTFPGEEDFRYLYQQSQSGGEYDTLYLKKYTGTNPEVNIPDHGTAYTRLSVIDTGSFTNRADLTKVVIPEGVTAIRASAFLDCHLLTDVTFPSTLTWLGYNVFTRCGQDAEEPFYFYLPDHLTVMGKMDSNTEYAFGTCKAIKVVNPHSETAHVLSSLGTIGWFSLPGKLDFLYQYYKSTDDGEYDRLRLTKYIGTARSVDIPEGIDAIGNASFADDYPLLRSVKIPEGVTVIETRAFGNCYLLTDVSFPDSLRSIAVGAFVNCGRDAEHVFYYLLPDHVTSIPANAQNPFTNCKARLCCTEGSVTWEQLGDRWWGQPKHDWMIRYESAGEDTRVILGGYYGPFGQAGSVNLVIPEELDNLAVTDLGEDLFNGRYDLASVVIPDSVKNIMDRAFKNCTYLNQITFPVGLSSIGENAFTGCGSGSYIFRLPGGIHEIVHTGPAEEGGPDVGSFDGCEAILYAPPGISGDGYINTRQALEAAGYTYITDLPEE